MDVDDGELRLDELLDDPMVRLVMDRDGVLREEILLLIQEVASRRQLLPADGAAAA
ncbi:MAG TPA: hypothetical protein VEB20_09220 [Azospirillaceae bacterium]|nr:hypothetical protein [Azospirillaceae bacterium]